MTKETSILLFIILLHNYPGFTQSVPDNRLLKKTNNLMIQEDWYDALNECRQLYDQAPQNPQINFMLAVCYQKNNRIDKSLQYLLFAKNHGETADDLDFYLGRAYQFNLKLDSAIDHFRHYVSQNGKDTLNNPYVGQARRHIEECNNGKLLLSDSLDLNIINVGPEINSQYAEYVPLISPDQSTLIFTSRRPTTTGGKMDKTGQYMEDIYISYKDKSGKWTPPDNHLPFNSREHDACVGLSVDGNTLIIYKPTNAGDLYISNFDGKKWSDPSRIKGDVNTPYWESSASITLDGKRMYFTSDKPGGLGGSDIYVAEKLADDTWGHVKNLGPTINTLYDEDAPQIHGDNVTLFFSSWGHNTMGGYDVFSSVYNTEDTTWSEPRNIGYPVNTPGDDIYFFLAADGSKGYFSSFREDSYGEKDIYEIQRPESSPAKFVMKFKLYDPFKNEALKADILIKDLTTGDTVRMNTTNSDKGDYNCVLNFENDYSLNLSAPGYAFKEKVIKIGYRADIFEYVMNIVPKREEIVELVDTLEANNIRDKPASIPGPDKERIKRSLDPGIRTINKADETDHVKKEFIYITRIDTREKVVVSPIQFTFNSYTVSNEQKTNLSYLAAFIKNSPNIHLIITGYTDSIGNIKYNEQLSGQRALSVKNSLVKNGLDESRIQVSGMGESNPIANNRSVFGRAFNRRVDFLLIDIYDKKYSQDNYAGLLKSFNITPQPINGYHTPFVVNEVLPVSVHFTVNSIHLTQYSTANLVPFINYLKSVPFNVILYGVADSGENKPSDLVEKRAEIVSQYFIDSGIQPSRIVTLTASEARQYTGLIKNEPGIESRRVQCILIKN